jgi:hypothetical protein
MALPARADTEVDTAYQSWGIAPRLELELGPQFAMGVGHACREEPLPEPAVGELDSDVEPVSSCNSGFFMLGGQALVLVRPFNHWALGVLYAYDAVLGAHEVSVDRKGVKKAAYARSSKRLAVELRWYSRSVSTSGLYVAAHAGAVWWADKIKPVTDNQVSQLAPELGVEVGGVFAPFGGVGTTLGLQAWMAWLRNSPQRSTTEYGSTYGYGTFVFVGLVARVELGISM